MNRRFPIALTCVAAITAVSLTACTADTTSAKDSATVSAAEPSGMVSTRSPQIAQILAGLLAEESVDLLDEENPLWTVPSGPSHAYADTLMDAWVKAEGVDSMDDFVGEPYTAITSWTSNEPGHVVVYANVPTEEDLCAISGYIVQTMALIQTDLQSVTAHNPQHGWTQSTDRALGLHVRAVNNDEPAGEAILTNEFGCDRSTPK